MSHVTHVEQLSAEEFLGYMQARAEDHRADTSLTDEDVIERVNAEAKDFDHVGGWLAYCECGWKGNNPYPGETAAREGVKEHELLIAAEENADG